MRNFRALSWKEKSWVCNNFPKAHKRRCSVENAYGNCVHVSVRWDGSQNSPLLKMREQSVRWIALGMTMDWRHQGEARQNESESSSHLRFISFLFS